MGADIICCRDPPYLHDERSSVGEYGEHEMTPEQHEELLEVLSGIEGNKGNLGGWLPLEWKSY